MKMIQKSKENTKIFHLFLNSIEKIGNGLPHPITLFALFALAVVLLSAVCAFFDVSAVGETINPATMELEKHTVSAVSLLTREGLSYMLTSAVSNFTSFAPLGVVLVTMLGVGCAEGSGYLSALVRRAILSTPRGIVTPMLVFLGVMSNIASDVGYVVLIPIGAVNRIPLRQFGKKRQGNRQIRRPLRHHHVAANKNRVRIRAGNRLQKTAVIRPEFLIVKIGQKHKGFLLPRYLWGTDHKFFCRKAVPFILRPQQECGSHKPHSRNYL